MIGIPMWIVFCWLLALTVVVAFMAGRVFRGD